jgi:hypothetical protein
MTPKESKMRIGSGLLFLLMSVLYLGQVVSVINLPLAQRLGLQEQPDTIDLIYARDAARTPRWDLLSMWTLPLAGLLMLLDNSWWPHLALIGGAIYVDTGGRQAIKLRGYRRERVRVGDDQAVRLAFAVYGTFLLLGAVAIAVGLTELDPV